MSSRSLAFGNRAGLTWQHRGPHSPQTVEMARVGHASQMFSECQTWYRPGGHLSPRGRLCPIRPRQLSRQQAAGQPAGDWAQFCSSEPGASRKHLQGAAPCGIVGRPGSCPHQGSPVLTQGLGLWSPQGPHTKPLLGAASSLFGPRAWRPPQR